MNSWRWLGKGGEASSLNLLLSWLELSLQSIFYQVPGKPLHLQISHEMFGPLAKHTSPKRRYQSEKIRGCNQLCPVQRRNLEAKHREMETDQYKDMDWVLTTMSLPG